MKIPKKMPAPLRWSIGLLLPSALSLFLGLCILWLESDADWAARRLGNWLLARNESRLTSGSTWQNISAQRRARALLDSSTRTPPIDAHTLPPHLLAHHYAQLQRTPHFARWRSSKRSEKLAAQSLDSQQLRALAESLQAFAQVDDLLAHIELPADVFDVHARIQAQTALEDGSLFLSLHRQLLAAQVPEAWNFTRMSPQDRGYWRVKLRPLLSSTGAGLRLPEAPVVGATLAALVASWSDSLRRDEIEHLRQRWRQTPNFELRLARNLDEFVGYVLLAGELPVRFVVPAAIATKAIDPQPEGKP